MVIAILFVLFWILMVLAVIAGNLLSIEIANFYLGEKMKTETEIVQPEVKNDNFDSDDFGALGEEMEDREEVESPELNENQNDLLTEILSGQDVDPEEAEEVLEEIMSNSDGDLR